MVFSSMHPYVDPGNWQQQQPNHVEHQIGSSSSDTGPGCELLPPPPAPHGSGSTRPGSMADRARLANIAMPETAQKCPRCDSTNTKFCYFNNYSLSQPRHLCKTCRRYWTRGGALRNVPVGGGCRRNKPTTKGKSTSSLSSPSSSAAAAVADADMNRIGLPCPSLRFTPTPPALPPQFASSSSDMGFNNYGFSNYTSLSSPPPADLGFHIATAFTPGGDHCRIPHTQQFPFQASPHFYQFEGGTHQLLPKGPAGPMAQPPSVKMEAHNHHHHQELNLSRQLLGLDGHNISTNHHHHQQYWNSGSPRIASNTSVANWTDLSGGFISSSTPTNNNPP